MIKIAYVIDSIVTREAGTEKQLLMLLDGLDRSIFEPHLVCLRESDWMKQNKPAPIHLIKVDKLASRQFISGISQFRQLHEKIGFDVVQTMFTDANLFGTIAAWRAGCPVILSSRRNIGHWHNAVHLNLLRLLGPFTTGYIANSAAAARITVQRERVPDEKVRVIYNGLDTAAAEAPGGASRERIRAQCKVATGDLLIGCVANLRTVKNIGSLIKAASQLCREFNHLKFVVVGEGPDRKRLQAIIEQHQLQEQFLLVGRKTESYDWLRAFDVAALCSRHESFSNSLMEYMMFGLPIVASNVGGNPEAIEHERTGLLYSVENNQDLCSALRRMITDEAFARACGANAKADAKARFSTEKMIETYQAYYQSLAHAPGSLKEPWERRSKLVKQRVYKRLSQVGVPSLMRRLHRDELTIIMYHGFTDRERGADIENIEGLHLHIDMFRQHLEHLKNHYNVISLDDALDALERRQALPHHAAVITMDDGYRSNHKLAFPLLREFSMPATIFLTTRFVDENRYLWTDRLEYAINLTEEGALRFLGHHFDIELGPKDTVAARGQLLRKVKQVLKNIPQSQRRARLSWIEEALGHTLEHSDRVPAIYESLDWPEVKELLDSGMVSVGSHSVSHFSLANCEEDVIQREIRDARALIEQRTGADCTLFCYPNGTVRDFDARTQRVVRANGHRCALTAIPGFNKLQTDPYALKRVGVMNEDTLLEFEMGLCGVRQMVPWRPSSN